MWKISSVAGTDRVKRIVYRRDFHSDVLERSEHKLTDAVCNTGRYDVVLS